MKYLLMKEISNNKLTLLRKLNQKKHRENEQLFLIEGSRAVQQVIANGTVQVKELYFDESQGHWQQEAWRGIGENHPAVLINGAHFREVSDTDNPQGVLALCTMPQEAGLEDLAEQSGVVIATDRIQDPGNLGTIIRTAAWFGAKGILSGKGTVDLFHPKVVRSTAGATGSVPHRNVELNDVLPEFERKGWKILILDGGGEACNIREVNPPGKTILIVGNEANGVDKNLFAEERKSVRISSCVDEAGVESLNAAIAAGIALYALTGKMRTTDLHR